MSQKLQWLLAGWALLTLWAAPAGGGTAENCMDPGVVNGSGEDTLASFSASGVTAPAGWSVTGGMRSLLYAAPGSLREPPGDSWGRRYFDGGDSPLATATQVLSVQPGCEGMYDENFYLFGASAHLGAVVGEPDRARVEARYLDSVGRSLGGFQIGEAPDGTPAPGGVYEWMWQSIRMQRIPPGTRHTELRVVLENFNGGRNTAWVDGIEAFLTWEDAVESTTWSQLKALYR